MSHVTVLGAGLAGLAAAQRCRQLGAAVDVYEKNSYLGGHSSSMQVKGFTFDEGPHVSFTKNQVVKDLLAQSLGGQYREFASLVSNYWRGYWIRHPAQVNLFGLPVDLVQRCLVDFTKAYYADDGPPANYEEWLYRQFGKSFSEEFPFRYTRKYWTVEPREMSTDWVGPRMYKPKLEEVVRGALAPNPSNVHYITQFRYPMVGGFGAYTGAVHAGEPVNINHRLMELDVRRRELRFENGRNVHYDRLVSSLPLPDLIRCIKDAPAHVAAAADRLVCTSLVLVDVAVNRDDRFPDAHWLYFYDEDVIFSRGSFPHLLSPHNAPPGCGSIQVEVYHTPFAPLPCQDVLSRTLDDLRRTGLLFEDDEILLAQQRHVKYANVLFNHDRAACVAIINAYLVENGITCCGRYGLWNYAWTDESIVSGWEAGDKVLAPLPGRRLHRHCTPEGQLR
jgi:protoporphyrinogen oxidase